MDEVLFRSSQKLENLQYQLGVAANEGKHFIHDHGVQAKDQIVRLLHHSRVEQLTENAKKLIVALLNLATEIKEKVVVYINPYNIYEYCIHTFTKRWSKRDICFGCTGFLIGGIVGYCIGLSWHRKKYPGRYMQAVQCANYLGIESVSVVEDALAPYECAKDEVLISVKAASVHTIDTMICHGYGRRIRKLLSKYYQYSKHDLPVTLGRDCTGMITDIGQNVTRLEIGDEVWMTTPFWAPGTFSQTVVAPECRVARKPKTVGFEGGCSLPYAGGLALDILHHANIDSNTARGKKILIQGGCTPVGCILIQILRSWDATVTCTCYKRAVPVAKALGANDIIILHEADTKNHETEKSKKEESSLFKELELRDPFDAIIITKDMRVHMYEFQKYCQKGMIFSTLPKHLSSDGFGFILGSLFGLYVRLKCVMQGVFGERLSSFGETHICSGSLDEISCLIESGKIQTVVDKVFHPHDIELALQHIESSDSIGSTVITFR